MVQHGLERRDGLVVLRRYGAAFAGDFGGDALRELTEGAVVDEERKLGLTEHVDETGCDDAAGGVDLSFGVRGLQVGDGGDAIAANADVSGVPGIACAVDDVA